MAPAKAVAAGWVCIALTHTLWQRLHRQFGLAFQLRMSESIVHVLDLHAQCYGAMMDARWHNRYQHGRNDAKAMHSKVSLLVLDCAHCELCCQWQQLLPQLRE